MSVTGKFVSTFRAVLGAATNRATCGNTAARFMTYFSTTRFQQAPARQGLNIHRNAELSLICSQMEQAEKDLKRYEKKVVEAKRENQSEFAAALQNHMTVLRQSVMSLMHEYNKVLEAERAEAERAAAEAAAAVEDEADNEVYNDVVVYTPKLFEDGYQQSFMKRATRAEVAAKLAASGFGTMAVVVNSMPSKLLALERFVKNDIAPDIDAIELSDGIQLAALVPAFMTTDDTPTEDATEDATEWDDAASTHAASWQQART